MNDFTKRNHTVSVAWFLLVAILLHVAILFSPLPKGFHIARSTQANRNKPIEIEPYDEKKYPEPDKPIVQTSKAKKQKKDKKARFAGEFDNHVDKETKSLIRGRFAQGGAVSNGSPEASDSYDEDEALQNGENAEKSTTPGHGEKSRRRKGAENLNMRDLLALGQSPNELPDDIANGSETVLGTDHVRYASFINRIADEIYDPWVKYARNAVEMLFHEGKRLESDTYVTKLGVFMDIHGKIEQIQVLQTSGVDELDEAPKKAFWEVEPFPNPPIQMFKHDEQTVKFVYEFHFEFKGSSFNIVPWRI